MEYLLVVGFSLAIIIPVTALLYDDYQERKIDLHLEHISELSRELAFQAEKIYYQGAPATTTIEASFPQGINAVTITRNSIEFTLEDTDLVIYADSKVNLTPTTLPTYPGPHRITLTVQDGGTLGTADDAVRIYERNG